MNLKNKNRFKIVPILKHPALLLVSAILAILTGVFAPKLALLLSPIGQIYLSLLKMSVLPILISAITMSIGRLMGNHNATKYIKRIFTFFPILLLFLTLTSVFIAEVFKPGRGLSLTTLQNLGILVNESGIDLEIPLGTALPEVKDNPGLITFLMSMIPENIFEALSEGDTLQVLFFSIIFGFILGDLQKNSSSAQMMLDSLETLYKAFNKLIIGLTLLLPLGLYSLLSTQIVKTGVNVVLTMVNFIVVAIGTYALIYLISILIIWVQSKSSLKIVFSASREPSILALATTSALACLPSMIYAMSDGLKFSKQTSNLVIPLGVTIGRFGQVVYFTLASLFVAQLYNTEIGISGFAIVIIGSIFSGMASSGATGIVTLTTLNVVLKPLGLPLEAALILFIAIDPIIDPFRTLCTVHTSMAATALITELEEELRIKN